GIARSEARRLGRTAGDAPTVVDLAERRAELRRAAVEASHECLPARVRADRRVGRAGGAAAVARGGIAGVCIRADGQQEYEKRDGADESPLASAYAGIRPLHG